MSTTYRTNEGDVLDDICWRHYGVQSGAVETVLDANRGLADKGPIFPAGVEILLPELKPVIEVQSVKLWE